ELRLLGSSRRPGPAYSICGNGFSVGELLFFTNGSCTGKQIQSMSRWSKRLYGTGQTATPHGPASMAGIMRSISSPSLDIDEPLVAVGVAQCSVCREIDLAADRSASGRVS